MRVSCAPVGADHARAEASGRIASIARATSPEARSASESLPSTRPTASSQPGARPDTVREGAVLGEARAAQGLADLVDAHLPRAPASREEPPRRCSSAPAASARPRRAPPRLRPSRPRRRRAPDPPRATASDGGLRRGEQSRGFRFRFGSLALAPRRALRRLSLRFRRAARETPPRVRRRGRFRGGRCARRPARRRPFRACVARLLELALEREAGGRGLRGQAVGFFAGERAGARFGDGPRQALLEVREVAGRAGLLGGEVAAFPLEGGARARRDPAAARRLDSSSASSRAIDGFERRQGFAQRVAAGGGLARPRAAP